MGRVAEEQRKGEKYSLSFCSQPTCSCIAKAAPQKAATRRRTDSNYVLLLSLSRPGPALSDPAQLPGSSAALKLFSLLSSPLSDLVRVFSHLLRRPPPEAPWRLPDCSPLLPAPTAAGPSRGQGELPGRLPLLLGAALAMPVHPPGGDPLRLARGFLEPGKKDVCARQSSPMPVSTVVSTTPCVGPTWAPASGATLRPASSGTHSGEAGKVGMGKERSRKGCHRVSRTPRKIATLLFNWAISSSQAPGGGRGRWPPRGPTRGSPRLHLRPLCRAAPGRASAGPWRLSSHPTSGAGGGNDVMLFFFGQVSLQPQLNSQSAGALPLAALSLQSWAAGVPPSSPGEGGKTKGLSGILMGAQISLHSIPPSHAVTRWRPPGSGSLKPSQEPGSEQESWKWRRRLPAGVQGGTERQGTPAAWEG